MKIKRVILEYKYQILIFICFIISLFFNTLTVQDCDEIKNYKEIDLFLFGLLSFLGGGILKFLIWMANPIGLASYFSIKKIMFKDPQSKIINTVLKVVYALISIEILLKLRHIFR